ncbi:MAG: asparagine synthase (glutamine-hydrolyzing) [Candidatus Ryanbacteria bacterium]|nr:asparagine synthase (glutamine-hydrolyzing) [Candidatus Ryanbacteria bacterium]
MCGIAGFYGRGDEALLRTMARTMEYRGPDDEGYYYNIKERIGLGFRRLSIIDIAGGQQPVWNEEKTVAVIFNGEIYNFAKLRANLEGRHHFKTHTDSEVIVHLYEEMQERCFGALEGMFAIAIWDEQKHSLVLARDRFGEKPLFWTLQDDTLIFASELKALCAHPSAKKIIDNRALAKYFFYEYIPGPASLFKNIHKLEPGTWLRFDGKQCEQASFYSLVSHVQNQKTMSYTDARRALESHLDRAVGERMVADVPLGVFLSGGIDSSTIAYFVQKHSSHPIKTFSVGFEVDSYDESPFARLVARRLGTEHFELRISEQHAIESIHSIFKKLDEPLADASLLPTYLLAEFTRKEVTVALGGDGGDELLLGYSTFFAHQLWAYYARIPSPARRFFENIVRALPVRDSYFSLDFKLKKFIDVADESDAMRNQCWLGAFQPSEYEKLFTRAFLPVDADRALSEDTEVRWQDSSLLSGRLQQIAYLYITQYMRDDILTKVDRASMYHSLEVRNPFLDSQLAAFALSLPDAYKLRRGIGKYILKDIMTPHLGKDIVFRKKQGFAPPLSRWLATGFRGMVGEYLNTTRINSDGIFQSAYVDRLVREHTSGRADHRKRLWTLLAFQLWHEHSGASWEPDAH